jgi:hypothetical protein
MSDLFNSIPGIDSVRGVITIFRALVIALDVALFFGFIYAFRKGRKFRPHFHLGKAPEKQLLTLRNSYFKDRWRKLIEKYVKEPTSQTMQLAVIEADALVDELLKDLNFPGDHLADRLQYLNNGGIKSLDNLWDAHRLRNEVVHRPAGGLSVAAGMSAIKKYEAFFKELKVL